MHASLLRYMVIPQVPDALKEMLGPDAPDVCIEAVGFHYMKSWLHKIENALMMETDTSEILNELIFCCRKASFFFCMMSVARTTGAPCQLFIAFILSV